MSNIPVAKTVFDKDLNKVIDINFSELNTDNSDQSEITIEEFFVLYEKLFYNIPKEEDTNSHRFILNKTADYLGVKIDNDIDIQALLEEITTLRQELLDVNKTLNINNGGD